MTRRHVLFGVSLFLVVTVPVATGVASTPATVATPDAMSSPGVSDTHNATDGANVTNATPGTTAASVLRIQGSAFEGTLRTATLEARLEAADTPAARARELDGALNRVAARTSALETRLNSLQAARENDSLGRGAFATRVAPVAANARSLGRLLTRIRTEASDLDATVRRRAGITADRLDGLGARLDRLVAADRGAVTTEGLGPEFYRRVATVVTAHNERVASQDLGVLGTYLDGERVNLHIVRPDGETAVVSFRTTADHRVRELQAGPHPRADLRVRVTEATARRLLNSDDPAAAANQAFLDGKITIRGLGLYSTVKWTLTNVALGALRLLADLLGALFGALLAILP